MTYELTPEVLANTHHTDLQKLGAAQFAPVAPVVEAKTENPSKIISNDFRNELIRGLHINDQKITHGGKIYFDNNNLLVPHVVTAEEEKFVAPEHKDKNKSFPFLEGNVLKFYTAEELAKLRFIDVATASDEELTKFLRILISGEINKKSRAELCYQLYSQSILLNTIQTINNVFIGAGCNYTMTETDSKTKPSERKPIIHNLFFSSLDNQIYLEITLPETILFSASGRQVKLKGSTWKFTLEETGFKFNKAVVEEKSIFHVLIGKPPILFLEDYPQYPLLSRIQDSFHSLYNRDSKNRADGLAFLGIPDQSTPYTEIYDKVETYPLGMVFTVPKNILKLFTEFLPAVVEKTSLYLLDQLQLSTNNLLIQTVLGFIPVVAYAVALTTRQIASRLTSPVRSFKEAYELGAKLHPVVGTALGIVSGILSIGLFTTAAVAFAAGLGALGVPYFATAASWVATNTSVIGSFISSVSMQLTAALGIDIGTEFAAIVAGSLIASTVFAAVVTTRDVFKQFLTWMASPKKVVEPAASAAASSDAASSPAENEKEKEKEKPEAENTSTSKLSSSLIASKLNMPDLSTATTVKSKDSGLDVSSIVKHISTSSATTDSGLSLTENISSEEAPTTPKSITHISETRLGDDEEDQQPNSPRVNPSIVIPNTTLRDHPMRDSISIHPSQIFNQPVVNRDSSGSDSSPSTTLVNPAKNPSRSPSPSPSPTHSPSSSPRFSFAADATGEMKTASNDVIPPAEAAALDTAKKFGV